MSVILSLEQGAIIDHEEWLSQLLKQSFNHHNERIYNFQGLFDIRTPFLMDDQAQKIAERLEGSREETLEPKRKKKKKGHPEVSHRTLTELEHIQNTFLTLQSTPEFKATFQYIPTPQDYKMNNIKVRNLKTRVMEVSDVTLGMMDEVTGAVLDTRLIGGNKYVLPPGVHYVCADVANILDHTAGQCFDLIVMDPPWINKHVRRKKSHSGTQQGYNMMNVKDILRIPIEHLLKDEGLVVVWSTNNASQIQDFLQGLHIWSVKHVATWYWLKVTKSGVPVTPLEGNCHSKLPYERIFIARKCKTEQSPEIIPDNFVLCSIPSGIHSHKPPLYELMKRFLAPEAQCLEVFARSLVPGWTSVGLEVLRLQHSFLFEDLMDSS